MENPVVSIVLRTHDRPQYLKEALQSIRDQTLDNFELIVVDTGIQEYPRSLIEDFPRPVTYIRKKNAANAQALNIGLDNCKGRYVAFLDDDDWWDRDFLKVMYECIKSEDADLVFCRAYYMKEGVIISTTPEFSGIDLLKEMLMQNLILINTVLISKNLLAEAGYFDEDLTAAVDWDMWLRALTLSKKFKAVNRFLSYIRVHESHISSDKVNAVRNEIWVLNKIKNSRYMSSKYIDTIKTSIARKSIYLGICMIMDHEKPEGRKRIIEDLRNVDLIRKVYGLTIYIMSFILSSDVVGMFVRLFYRACGRDRRRVFF